MCVLNITLLANLYHLLDKKYITLKVHMQWFFEWSKHIVKKRIDPFTSLKKLFTILNAYYFNFGFCKKHFLYKKITALSLLYYDADEAKTVPLEAPVFNS